MYNKDTERVTVMLVKEYGDYIPFNEVRQGQVFIIDARFGDFYLKISPVEGKEKVLNCVNLDSGELEAMGERAQVKVVKNAFLST